MKKLLFLLLGSFSMHISAMDERPTKRFKKDKSSEQFLTDVNKELLNAVLNNNEKAVKEALDKGANPNIKNGDNSTLLYMAVSNNNEKIIRLLLSSDLNLQFYNDSRFPLHAAALNYATNIINLLILYGFDVNHPGSIFKETPLMSCIRYSALRRNFNLNRYLETVKLLIKKTTNINAQNQDGDTALMLAIRSESHGDARGDERFKNSELIQYLIEHGALISIKNNKEETALDIAKKYETYGNNKKYEKYGNKTLVEFLENKIREKINLFQQQIPQEVLNTTSLPNVLIPIISEYLEEY